MDKCGIGKLSGTDCGSVNVKGTVITEYQTLSDCQRDITGHLEMLKMRGDDVSSEKELILLRAGEDIFVALSSAFFPIGCYLSHGLVFHILGVFEGSADMNFRVCPKHRDSFGIKWRGRKKLCQVPEGVASHRSKKHTGDRTINTKLSVEIFNRTGSLIPIGSGIHLYNRYLFGMSH